jgi:DNA-3-methyladenine glycosylase
MHERIRLAPEAMAVPASVLAPRLLGCVLVRQWPDGTRLSGTIVETEAYVGVKDRASHAFGGRRTERNESMYCEAGTLYVYFTYGMHYCANVVCGARGEPAAVLIRGLDPIDGLGIMKANRGLTGAGDHHLCSGPAKLCRALGIDRNLDRIDMNTSHEVWIEDRGEAPRDIGRSGRIGIGEKGVWTRRNLRWFIRGNRSVSGPRGKSA